MNSFRKVASKVCGELVVNGQALGQVKSVDTVALPLFHKSAVMLVYIPIDLISTRIMASVKIL